MRNLTLAIEDEILLEARKFALERNTTVNQLVRDYLGELVDHQARRRSARERIRRFMATRRVQVGRKTWTRDEIHER